ncbi:hypothetical protein [Rubrimonas cliftonensis]|uniref:Amidinotransferase n=1 Tax=Rubrimonas cliftonensis TaxID=89524 RepID=A0A1H4CMJ7_9RHOB|nr:hypothetical protein [Rubrimonas cliftonensis]SEA61549.1 Amidinotransferase [Rubrimonas cliftonensis]
MTHDPMAPRWRLSTEPGRLTDMLLCRPDHYARIPSNAIARATLAASTPLDRAQLLAEYAEFEAALDEAGIARHHLAPDPAPPCQVYTRDSSQTAPGGPAMTLLAMPQRRGEYAAVMAFHGAGFWRCATAGSVEGGDIHLIRPVLAAIGHSGGRTRSPAPSSSLEGGGLGGRAGPVRRRLPPS